MTRTKCVMKSGATLLCALLAASIGQAAQAGEWQAAPNTPTQTATNQASKAVGPNADPGTPNPPAATAPSQTYSFKWIPDNGDIVADPAPSYKITWTYAYGATFTTTAGPNSWAKAIASFGRVGSYFQSTFSETNSAGTKTTDPITGTPATRNYYYGAPPPVPPGFTQIVSW